MAITVKALKSFVGIISMRAGEVREIVDEKIAKDLLKAGHVVKAKAEKEAAEKEEKKPEEPKTEEPVEEKPVKESAEPVENTKK